MTTFNVRGLTAQGALRLLRVSAASRSDAEHAAREAGLRVLDIQSAGFSRPALFASSTGGGFDLALFAHELVALLGAGLSLIETLETLAERQEGAARGGSVLGQLVRRMQEGQAFSSALRTFPAIFPELFIASIAASEHTGEMVPALQRYLRYHEQLGVIRQKIISASLYPAMLCAVGAAVALFLLCFLVPRFSRVYEGMEDKLPVASRWLMQWGLFASAHWVLIAGLLIAAAVALPFALTRPGARVRMGDALQASRWIGGRIRLMQLSRFYRSLGLLLGGGIPVVKALNMAQGLLPLRLQPAALSATRDVTQGRSLGDSLQTALLFAKSRVHKGMIDVDYYNRVVLPSFMPELERVLGVKESDLR